MTGPPVTRMEPAETILLLLRKRNRKGLHARSPTQLGNLLVFLVAYSSHRNFFWSSHIIFLDHCLAVT